MGPVHVIADSIFVRSFAKNAQDDRLVSRILSQICHPLSQICHLLSQICHPERNREGSYEAIELAWPHNRSA
jgi:hypothetical protein